MIKVTDDQVERLVQAMENIAEALGRISSCVDEVSSIKRFTLDLGTVNVANENDGSPFVVYKASE